MAERRDAVPDVMVVGAGPVGMTAAALLAAEGLMVRVVERRSFTSDEPKAISIDDESLRVYQRAGIAGRLMSIIVPGIGTRYFDSERTEVFQARAARPYRFGYPFKNPFAQPDLERVLAQSLEDHPLITVDWGTAVTSIKQDDEAVTLQLVDSAGRPADAQARWVLAADGGRSTVRSLLQIPMSGRSHATPWLVVDTLGDPHTERYGMHFGDPRRPHVIVPGLAGRCRYEFLLQDGEGDPGSPPSFELISRLLAPYRQIRADEVERAVIYTFHGLNADRWRQGRVFLLGDAAHMMPPFAGQGLNSGIRDASNLTWKIAAVERGRLDAAVLESYESERRPHASATIRLSEKLGRVVMTTSPRLAAFRDERVRAALETPVGRAFFEEMQYRPAARIERGLLAPTSKSDAVGTAIGQPQVFDSSTHRVRPLDEVLGGGWALLGVDVPEDSWVEALSAVHAYDARPLHIPLTPRWPARLPVDAVLIDVDERVYQEFASHAGRFLLVRPDRVIAAAWAPNEHGAVRALLAQSIPPGLAAATAD